MIITKIVRQKKRIDYYSIFLDGNYSFSISEQNLLNLQIIKGKEVNIEDFNEIVQEEEKHKAMGSAWKLLHSRSRSIKELKERLNKKMFSETAVDYVIGRLLDLGYLNDNKFAHEWLSFMKQKGKGIELIKIELRRKGISSEIISDAVSDLKESDEEEVERVKKIASQKLKLLHNVSEEKASRRLLSFLSRRGFSHETIRKALKDISKNLIDNE